MQWSREYLFFVMCPIHHMTPESTFDCLQPWRMNASLPLHPWWQNITQHITQEQHVYYANRINNNGTQTNYISHNPKGVCVVMQRERELHTLGVNCCVWRIWRKKGETEKRIFFQRGFSAARAQWSISRAQWSISRAQWSISKGPMNHLQAQWTISRPGEPSPSSHQLLKKSRACTIPLCLAVWHDNWKYAHHFL